MKIPKSLKLYGQNIIIEHSDKLVQESDNSGEAHYRLNKIILQKDSSGNKRKTEQIELTFIHELIHFIMHYASYEKLSNDEQFTKRISGLLHQALDTMEYE